MFSDHLEHAVVARLVVRPVHLITDLAGMHLFNIS